MEQMPESETNKYTFTVFIPTYNRAHTLGRALQSIANQTFRDLEVLIIDDGSTDDTCRLIEEWRERAWYPIHYFWQQNQGKTTAHNNALAHAKGFFFVLLDSDDMLHPRALERFKSAWDAIPKNETGAFAGIEGLCVDTNGNVSGTLYPKTRMNSNYLEITKKYGVTGEKKSAIRTAILRRFPYPHFEGERHIRDDIIWKRISHHYRFLYINEIVQIIEYQPDGLSADVFSLRMENPKGFRFYFLEEINVNAPFTKKPLLFKYHSKFVRYSLHSKVGLFQQYREVNSRLLWLLSVPRGIIGWFEDCIKMRLRVVCTSWREQENP